MQNLQNDQYALAGVRLAGSDECDQCLNCYLGAPVVGVIFLDSEGYAYLNDYDGWYEFQECVSCITCDGIIAPGLEDREEMEGGN